MQMPNVPHEFYDETKNIRYVIMAYRQMSKPEALQALRVAVANMKGKPKKNKVYTFYSLIGAHDPI